MTLVPRRRCAAALFALCVAGSSASTARADGNPERYLLAATVGAPLRLTRDQDLDQSTLAPLYTDVLAGYVLPGGHVRHGLGAALSMNLTDDGGYTEPVAAGDQLALAPSYLLYVDIGPDSLLLGQVGLPIVLTGGSTVGLAVSGAYGYRVLAGMGVMAELGFETFVGVSSRLHPSVSLELGVFLDYEVLP